MDHTQLFLVDLIANARNELRAAVEAGDLLSARVWAAAMDIHLDNYSEIRSGRSA